MENNDNMIEDLQPELQPEAVLDAADAEVQPESEPVMGEPSDEPQETVEEPVWKKWINCVVEYWGKATAFIKGCKKPVLYAVIAGVVVLVVLLVWPWNKDEKNRYETLGQTITEMKKISEFCTANYIGEVMIQDEEKKFLNRKNIVIIVRGKIRAGFDLSQMETQVVNDSTINLSLPSAQILDVITNPSDTRIFNEKGNWTHEEVTNTINAARAKLVELVMEDNLLATAENNGERQLKSIFSAFGFKDVNITFVADSTVCDSTAVIGDSVSGSATILFAN